MDANELHRQANRRYYAKNREREITRSKAWRVANPERYKLLAKQNGYGSRRRSVGVVPDGFNKMLAAQNNTCAICAVQHTTDKPLHVDHDHSTGKVRGLLCQGCNIGIGHLKDDAERLRAAANYLDKHHTLQKLL